MPIKLENVGIAVRDLEATIAGIIVMLAEELKKSRPGADRRVGRPWPSRRLFGTLAA